jgi:Na+/H+ antiporter NhaD/arsenite permease-like protein
MAVAVAAFLIALAIIASEKMHRTNVALLGAAIVVLFVGGFSQEQAIEAVDFSRSAPANSPGGAPSQ